MSDRSNPEDGGFFIGWQEKAPPAFGRATRRFIGIILAIVLGTAVLLVLNQRGFDASVFELGHITTHEGILIQRPVPMLKVREGQDEHGSPLYRSILLIGFGKRGAATTLRAIETAGGQPLEGRTVKLRGTRIYYDGKTALELTEGIAAFAGFGEAAAAYAPREETLGTVSLRGEILDPKCALGVMKPGYGKPHRSCAVRCISGGIPPILRVTSREGETNYCVVLGKDGQPVNAELLDFIADQVRLCGILHRQDDWLILWTDPQTDIFRLKPFWMEGDIPLCGKQDFSGN